MKKSKLFFVLLAVAIIAGAVFKISYSSPKQLDSITSPDGKITATISEKSGNIIIETNRSNPLTIDTDHNIEYGCAAFSRDSRYLFVAGEKSGYGIIECRDFVENESFSINTISIIRTSDEFTAFAADNGIEECHDRTVTVIDINEHSIANLTYSFKDRNGKEYTPMVGVDLYNQRIEVFK